MTADWQDLARNPDRLLQQLIRFDTTNPPGNEAACIHFIDALLTAAGIPTTLLGRSPERPNLLARLPGRGEAPPLLMYGHVDVVTTAGQEWRHPPFAGDEAEGYIWGRGALDMKSGVAMMLAALLRARLDNVQLPGDLLFCALADEEDLGDYGAGFLVDQHPEQFENVRYAIGEFGGFSLEMAGRRFYPIMIAEKQVCWMRMTLRGPAGHGSMPVRGGAMAALGRVLAALDRRRLPTHVTPPARMMIEAMAGTLGGPTGLLLRQLTSARLANPVLDLLGARGRLFDPLLHNTVSPTGLHASDKINVIPGAVTLDLDGRLLPGFGPDDMLAELRALLGGDPQIEVQRYDPGPAAPDMALFSTLAGVLRESDPQGVPIPLLLSGVTDGRYFAKLGIQTYGFTPMRLPADFAFTGVIHAADERIPVGAVAFGAGAIYRLLQRMGR